MKHLTPLMALCLSLTAAPVLAKNDCNVPAQHWQTRDAVLQHAAAQGWQVQRLKIDDGCYEIRGRDAQDRDFKAKLDPETLRVVKMKLRDDNGDRDRKRKRKDNAPAGAAAPTNNPVLTPGTKPRGQIG
uniref:PepSY domain-containing protein n=1 Tax=Castellaniella defragrans TaxID=75697 RepID=UPI00333F5F8D